MQFKFKNSSEKKITHQIEPGIIITGSKIIHSYIYISIHWWLITKIVWCTLPIPFRTNKLQSIWTDFGPMYWCQIQSLNNSTSLWLITKSLHIPIKTNSAKPIQTDLGALSAISAFQSLNKT